MKKQISASFLLLSTYFNTECSLAQQPRLEEVKVTAQKRSENLNQVPLAIDVVSATSLSNASIDSLSQIEDLSPSMNFGRAGRKSRGEITIRGVGDFSRNIGTDPRVAVYIDDVPLSRSSSYDLSLLSIEQVEILKGPQGTLFGANAIAGAINIVSKQPAKAFSLGARVGAGSFGYQAYSLITDIPINTTLHSRIIIGHQKSDGFIDNVFLDNTIQGSDSDTARVSLLFSPNNSLSLTVNADWMKEESHSANGLALNSEDPFKGFDMSPGAREVAHNNQEFENRKIFGSSLNAKWNLDSGMHIQSISAIRGSKFSDLSEEDYSPTPYAFSEFNEKFDQLSQEIRIISPDTHSVGYVVGAFLSTQEVITSRSASLLNLADQRYATVNTPGELNNNTAALFGNLTIDVNTMLSLDLGLRIQNEEKHLHFTSIDNTGSFVNGSIDDKKSFSALLPRIAINFSSGDKGLVYYSVAKGAKSGGWNADFVTTLSDIDFKQETAINVEIGYKKHLADDKIRISLAAFKTDFRDFQVFQFITQESSPEETSDNPENISETLIKITNAGEATSQGIELDIAYQITASLFLHAKATTLQARFDKFDNANTNGESFASNSLPYAPELTAYFGVEYQKNLSSSTKIAVQLDYSYSDEYFSNPNNNALYHVDQYYHTNASIALHYSKRWSIRVWGKNLSDETYLKYRDISFLGVQRGYFAPPRSYGVTLEVN